jgi:plasmid stabilization system protein ParE
MKPFILTPRAAQDVGDIWDYIADDSIEAADRVLDALEKAMYRLSKTPGVGHVREELADRRHRFFPVYSYLIVYRFETKPLQVLRVLQPPATCKASWGLARRSCEGSCKSLIGRLGQRQHRVGGGGVAREFADVGREISLLVDRGPVESAFEGR